MAAPPEPAIFLPVAAVRHQIVKSFRINIFRHRATFVTRPVGPAIRNLKGEGPSASVLAGRLELESGKGARPGAGAAAAVLRGPSWPAEVTAAWGRLWALAPRHHAFNGPAWTAAWAGSRGTGLDLFAPVVRDGQGIVGLLPLVRDADGVLRFHGRPECDYADMLAAPEGASLILEQTIRALVSERGWRRAELDNVREDGILAAALDELPADLRGLVSVERQAPCPAVSVAAGGAGVFAALAAKDKLRQYHRKLARLGEVHFQHLELREEILAQLPGFFRQHQERSVLAGRDSQFLDARPRRFYEELVRTMDPASELRFGVLRVGERIAACHFGFEANGRFLFYKPTFDVALWDYSPGQVLLRALFEYADARKLAVFDFTIGDEEYKHRFANEVVHTLRITIARTGGGARLAGWTRSTRSRLREVPALRSLVARLRGRGAATVRAPAPIVGYRPGAPDLRPGSPAAERGGLAELAALSLEHPSAFPAAAIPALRPRLKADELWIGRRDGRIVAAGWCGEREATALWPDAARSRVVFDAWALDSADRVAWTDRLLETAAAGRTEALPLLVLAADGSLLADEGARRGWPKLGRIAAAS